MPARSSANPLRVDIADLIDLAKKQFVLASTTPELVEAASAVQAAGTAANLALALLPPSSDEAGGYYRLRAKALDVEAEIMRTLSAECAEADTGLTIEGASTPSDLISLKMAAHLARTHVTTVVRWVKADDELGYKRAGRWSVRRSRLEQMLAGEVKSQDLRPA